MGLEARSIGAAAIILVSSADSLADYIRVRACRSSVTRVVEEMEAPCGGGITLAREPVSQPAREEEESPAGATRDTCIDGCFIWASLSMWHMQQRPSSFPGLHTRGGHTRVRDAS
eukprot:GHVU01055424.1.p1 GENE.GHVU01055424.1~~GHVU01055424.1.p1  ORF type:complete len:115 (+),score=10.24 GHVU01055424.1:309-653(+)